MEGIEQNPIVYELMSEMAFQHKKVDVKVILSSYTALHAACASHYYCFS